MVMRLTPAAVGFVCAVRRAVVLLMLSVLAPFSAAVAAPIVVFDLQSDAGDYVGQGGTYHRTEAGATLYVTPLDLTGNGTPDFVTINLNSGGGQFIIFQLGTNQLGLDLAPGTYLNAQRASFASPGRPGIDVGMDGRGCNIIAGDFVINAVVLQGMSLRYLDMDFVQHCEGAPPALRGSVLYADGAATTTTVAPSAPSVLFGTPITLTATVTGTSPTGTVAFQDGLATIAGCANSGLTGAGNVRTAQCITSSLGLGSHTIVARYSGDATNLPSSGSTSLSIGLPGCAGFSDINSADPFCPSVDWIRSRGITQGCTASTYCPSNAVTRLAMAAFLARLGTALTPAVLTVDTVLGALPLALSPTACQTGDFAVDGFVRRANAIAIIGAKATGNVDLGIEIVASFDLGQNWTPISGFSRVGLNANRWSSVSAIGSADLAVGQNVRFGVRVGTGGAPFVGDLNASTCQLRVEIGNRN
jgi:Bacterial Ig-like domain (group 3)